MAEAAIAPAPEAPLDCSLCPRLVAYRRENQAAEPDWFNAPAPSFGDERARLLVVGLAPGRGGANRTGRPFTGDYAGELLYPALLDAGFARGIYRARPDDGLKLVDCMITNAVRCVPPANKPTGEEAGNCRPFLRARIAALPKLTALLALGRIAHDAVVTLSTSKRAHVAFGHNAQNDIEIDGRRLRLFDSYHCSRYNVNTGRLTREMFDDVLRDARAFLAEGSAAIA